MIQIIDGLPDNVVGFEAVGEVHKDDYKTVLDPAIDAALKTTEKIRLLYVLGDGFTGFSGGAMWQDAKVGVDHWSHWQRIALVTDHKGYIDGVKAFDWMVPGEVRIFSTDALDGAKAWVSEES